MKVDFLIIGAGRSGTTTIYEYLKKHPKVSFSKIKEIHFFSINELFNRGISYYHNFFGVNTQIKKYISADTYLFISDIKIIKRIFNYNPEMKFIVMLRNPVERAFSGYQYAINNGYLNENINFIQSIKNEKNIIQQNKTLIEQNNICNAYQGQYYFHLKRWMNIFPRENFLLLKTSDLKDNVDKILNQISNFMNIDNFDISKQIKANKASGVKSKKIEQILLNRELPLRKFLRKIIPEKLKQKIFDTKLIDKMHNINRKKTSLKKITSEEKIFAQKIFNEDLSKLKKELNIDLL